MAHKNRRYRGYFRLEDRDKGYAWVVLVVAFLLSFLEMGSFSIQGVFFIEYLEYFQTSKVEVSIVGSLVAAFFGFSGLVLGPVVARVGLRAVVIFGSVLTAVCMILACVAPHFPVIIIFMGILLGISCGCQCLGGIYSVMQFFDKKLSFASAIQTIGFCLGGFVFPMIASALINAYSWRGALLILGGVHLNGIALGALIRPIEPTNDESEDEVTRTFRDKVVCFLKECFDLSVLKRGRLVVHFFSVGLVVCGEGIPWIYLPPRAFAINDDKRKAALVVAVMGLTSTFVRPFTGFFGDHIRNYKPLAMCISAVIAGTLMSVSYYFLSYEAVVGLAVCIGSMSAVYMVFLQSIIPDLAPPDRVGHAVGFAMFLYGSAALIATPVAGHLIDVTNIFSLPFVVFGIVMVIGGFLSFVTFILQRRYLRSQIQDKKKEEMAVESIF